MASPFADLLNDLARRYRSKKAFADALGMSPSRLLRASKGEFAFDAVNCLKLARMTGESPTRILRAAGKEDLAGLIEELYGNARPSLSKDHRDLVDHFEQASPDGKDIIRQIVAKFAEEGRRKRRKRTA